MPRPYPPQFRRRALDLVESGRTVRDVAAALGIAESALHRWRQRDLVDRGLKPGPTSLESAELAAAHARIRDLEEEVKILRKAAAAVEAVVPPKERFRLVAELNADGVRVARACQVLGVSRSGYYDWTARAPSVRAIRHAWLSDQIAAIHAASHGTYGRLRIHAELVHAGGVVVGHNTVGLLMRRAQLAGLPTHRRGKRSRRGIIVTDLVRRDFHRAGPNQLWVTDITEHPAREGKLYCCVVIDTYSRRVVGWAIDSRQRADLATNALGMAIDSRSPSPGTIIHGDHGPQGGFNRSSQHPVITEVFDGSSAARCGSRGAKADAFAGSACPPAGGGEGVLGRDRQGAAAGGGRFGGRCVAAGRRPVVPPRWRHAAVRSGAAVGPVLVFP